METIEPNPAALLFFVVSWSVASIAFYVLAGAFPLETRPDLRNGAGVVLVGADVLLLVALAGGSLFYGASSLRWTSFLVVIGLGALFAPGVYNLWPSRLRDGIAGLLILLSALVAALVILAFAGKVINISA